MYGRIILITKKTPLEELLEKHNNVRQVEYFLKSRGESIATYKRFHEQYKAALGHVRKNLPSEVPHFALERGEISRSTFRQTDLVIALGPDGLFANVAKHLDGHSVITLNPDPETIDGIIMQTHYSNVKSIVKNAIADTAQRQEVVLAKVETNDGQVLYGANDIFVGRNDQVSARYTVEHAGEKERQSSSGIVISTGMGSTGWFRSILTMADRLCRIDSDDESFAWNDEILMYVVREAFPSKSTNVEMTSGCITKGRSIKITSEMPEGGIIFSDGMARDGITFNAGTTVEIEPAEKTVSILT